MSNAKDIIVAIKEGRTDEAVQMIKQSMTESLEANKTERRIHVLESFGFKAVQAEPDNTAAE